MPDLLEKDKSARNSNDPSQSHYDREFAGIVDNYDKGASSELNAKEEAAEARPKYDNEGDDANHYGFYQQQDKGGKPGLLKNVYSSYKQSSNLKKSAGAGGIIGMLIAIFAFFSFLGPFQLVHLVQGAQGTFDGQTERATRLRAPKHFKLALDDSGKGYYKPNTVNEKIKGRLGKGYSTLDPAKIRADLKAKGIDASVNARGNLMINGVELDGKISGQRKFISKQLADTYPNDGFLKRSVRKSTAFKAFGIQRTFFENTKKKVSNAELDMISKLRNRQNGNSADAARVSFDEPEDGKRGKLGDLGEATNAESNRLSEGISDPEFDPGNPQGSTPPTAVDVRESGGTQSGGTTKPATPELDIKIGGVTKTLALDGAAQFACEAKYKLKLIELATMVVRYRALIAFAGSAIVAADQLKTGKDVNMEQLGALMTILTTREPGIGQSGSYKQLFNTNKDPKEIASTNQEKFSLDLTSAGGTTGNIADLNKNLDDTLNNLTGGKAQEYCGLTRNIFYQLGSGAVGLVVQGVAAVGSGGTSLIASGGKLLAQISLRQGLEIMFQKLLPTVAQNLAGPAATLHFQESQSGAELFDALAAGLLATSSSERYQNGMSKKLSVSAIKELETQIALEKAEEQKNDSVLTKYFALNNSDSFLTRKLVTLPSTPQGAMKSTGAFVASLPNNFIGALQYLTPFGKAKAEAVQPNSYLVNNPMSIPMYGLTDTQIEGYNTKYSDPVANETAIYESEGGIEAYNEWAGKCYPEDEDKALLLHGVAATPEEEEILADCTNESNDALKERYMVYRLDRTLQQGILFSSGASDCLDPDSEDPYCSFETSSGTGSSVTSPVGPSKDGWVWPVQKDLVPGPCWDPKNHAGIDINSSSPNNPAIAAHNGTVVKIASSSTGGDAGAYVIVKAEGKELWYSYQHLVDGSIKVKEGDTVTAGSSIIGSIGKTGRVFASSPGHLHFVIAVSQTLSSRSDPSESRDPLGYLPDTAPGGYKCY